MANITPADVAKLRAMTGAGMLECKKALVASDGNMDAAVDFLRKKGQATAAKKALKEATEGIIANFVQPDGKLGALVEVSCQTDFVARNEDFQAYCNKVAATLASDPNADLETERTAMVAKLGENIQIGRHERIEVSGSGMVAAYIHTGGKVGVLVEVGCGRDETTAADEFKQLVKDITLQIAAASPIAVSRDQVDPAVVAKEREIAEEQFKDKPPQAIAKIVEGKLNSFFQSTCLADQGFVKDPDKTVQAYVDSVGKQLGDEIQIRKFVRFQVGETSGS